MIDINLVELYNEMLYKKHCKSVENYIEEKRKYTPIFLDESLATVFVNDHAVGNVQTIKLNIQTSK
jgi:hypothetical protein